MSTNNSLKNNLKSLDLRKVSTVRTGIRAGADTRGNGAKSANNGEGWQYSG
jgi:hypothetical protein